MDLIEYNLNLSTGETIEIAELDLSAGFTDEDVLEIAAPVLDLCSRVPRAFLEEAKQGYDTNLKPLLRDPRRAMMKLERPVCKQISYCPMANRQECTLLNITLPSKSPKLAGQFPICFGYELKDISMSAESLCDNVIQLWRRGLYVVIVT